MTTKSTQTLDKKLFADLQLTDEVIGNDYAADGVTVVGTARIPVGDLLRKGIVALNAPLATVNTENTVSVAGPILGQTTDDKLVVKFSQTGGVDGWEWLIVSQGGKIFADIELAEKSGTVPSEAVLGQSGGVLTMGDGLTSGGIRLAALNEIPSEAPAGGIAFYLNENAGPIIDFEIVCATTTGRAVIYWYDGAVAEGIADGGTGLITFTKLRPSPANADHGFSVPRKVSIYSCMTDGTGRPDGAITEFDAIAQRYSAINLSSLTRYHINGSQLNQLLDMGHFWTFSAMENFRVDSLSSANDPPVLDLSFNTVLDKVYYVNAKNLKTLNVSNITGANQSFEFQGSINLNSLIAYGFDGCGAGKLDLGETAISTDALYNAIDQMANARVVNTVIDVIGTPCAGSGIFGVPADGAVRTGAETKSLADSKGYSIFVF